MVYPPLPRQSISLTTMNPMPSDSTSGGKTPYAAGKQRPCNARASVDADSDVNVGLVVLRLIDIRRRIREQRLEEEVELLKEDRRRLLRHEAHLRSVEGGCQRDYTKNGRSHFLCSSLYRSTRRPGTSEPGRVERGISYSMIVDAKAATGRDRDPGNVESLMKSRHVEPQCESLISLLSGCSHVEIEIAVLALHYRCESHGPSYPNKTEWEQAVPASQHPVRCMPGAVQIDRSG